MSSKLEAIKQLDTVGIAIALVLGGLALASGYAALHFGWFRSPWELAVWLVVCVAFLVIGLPSQSGTQATIALSKWATRADIEQAGIDENPSRPLKVGEEGIYLGFFADKVSALTLRYFGKKHLLGFGPPGANKSTGLFVTNLAHLRRSIIVLDPKGELAAITARAREKFGRVIVLNPFDELTDKAPHLKSEGWNPLRQLDKSSPDFGDDALCIADAIIEGSGDGKDKFFYESAKNLTQALLMWEVITHGKEAKLTNLTTLLTVDLVGTLKAMSKSENKIVQETGQALSDQKADKNSKSETIDNIVATIRSNINFLYDERIGADMWFGRATPSGDFRKADAIPFENFHKSITTVYLILPLEEIADKAKWMRIFVNLALRKLYKSSPKYEAALPPVMFMLDEFGNLGRLQEIIRAMTTARGKRVQLFMLMQTLGQLKEHYANEWTNFFAGAGAVTTFKTGDTETAEQFGKIYGNREESVPTLTATGVSNTPHAIPLIRPEDIGRLRQGEVISSIEPCNMPVKGSAPIYPETRFADGLDANPYFHG